MWISNFTGNMRIEIYFEPNIKIDKILIWNFNGRDLSKGIREVEIIRKNKIIWKGIVQKGTNISKGDYSTKIKLEKESSITNFDFINLIYRESLENFDFLTSNVNSPAKSLLKSNTTNSNLNTNNNANNKNYVINNKCTSSTKVTNLDSMHINTKSEKINDKNIFVENNLPYNNSNCNSNNNYYFNNNLNSEIISSDDPLRKSLGSLGKSDKANFESLTASSARNNPFVKSSSYNVNKQEINASNSLKKSINSATTNNINNPNTNTNASNNNKNVNYNISNNLEYTSNNNRNIISESNKANSDIKIIGNLSNSSNFVYSENNVADNVNANANASVNLINNNFSKTKNPQQSNLISLDNEIENLSSSAGFNKDFSNNSSNNLFKNSIIKKNKILNSNSHHANYNNTNYSSKNNQSNLNSDKLTNNTKQNVLNSSNNKLNIHSLSSNNNSFMESKKPQCLSCKRLKIILRSSYGDPEYVGLTGLQFFDENEEPINIEKAKTIGALPKDINTVMNNCGDPRIFENVFNQINETNDDNYMWLTLYNSATPPYIELSYEECINISTIKFWNYNRNGDLQRGVKQVDLIVDEDYKNQLCNYFFMLIYCFIIQN